MLESRKQILQIEGVTLSELIELLDERERKQQKEIRAYIEARVDHASGIATCDGEGFANGAGDKDPNKLLTEADLVKKTGFSRQTLRKYRLSGVLQNVKSLEPRIRYTPDAVAEFLKSGS